MTTSMERFVEGWLFDPTMGQLTSATVGILIVLVRVSREDLNRYGQKPSNRYREKKMVSVLGYFTGLLIMSVHKAFAETRSCPCTPILFTASHA